MNEMSEMNEMVLTPHTEHASATSKTHCRSNTEDSAALGYHIARPYIVTTLASSPYCITDLFDTMASIQITACILLPSLSVQLNVPDDTDIFSPIMVCFDKLVQKFSALYDVEKAELQMDGLNVNVSESPRLSPSNFVSNVMIGVGDNNLANRLKDRLSSLEADSDSINSPGPYTFLFTLQGKSETKLESELKNQQTELSRKRQERLVEAEEKEELRQQKEKEKKKKKKKEKGNNLYR